MSVAGVKPWSRLRDKAVGAGVLVAKGRATPTP